MRLPYFVLAVSTVVTIGACQPTPPRAESAPGANALGVVEQRVRATFDAIARDDTAALGSLLSDSLRWISPTTGAVYRKPQLLGAAARLPAAVTLRYAIDSVRVWRAGPVATAEYRITDSRTFAAHTNAFTSRGLDVFAWESGAWRLRQHAQMWVPRSPATLAVDTAPLRAFVGRYDRGDGFIDDVHLESSGLMATSSAEKAMGAQGAHLLPVSEDAFSPDGSAPLIVFERDAAGRVTGYVQQQPDGVVVRARRLAVAQTGPSPESVRRLAPASFPALPVAIRNDLERRRCLVPQPYDAHASTNIVHGAFRSASVSEWAILCSAQDTSQILLYRAPTNGDARPIDSLQRAADVGWMQQTSDTGWGFSRVLRTLPLERIRTWHRDIDGHTIPQPVDHDAIEQLFLGKAAEAFYCAAGRWYHQVTTD